MNNDLWDWLGSRCEELEEAVFLENREIEGGGSLDFWSLLALVCFQPPRVSKRETWGRWKGAVLCFYFFNVSLGSTSSSQTAQTPPSPTTHGTGLNLVPLNANQGEEFLQRHPPARLRHPPARLRPNESLTSQYPGSYSPF